MKTQVIHKLTNPICGRQTPVEPAGRLGLAATLPLTLGLVLAPAALAAEVTCATAVNINADSQMNCFNPNTQAKSAEVNANFNHLLQQNKQLRQSMDTLQQNNQNLLQRLADLEAKLVAVSYDAGEKKLQISGANVQIVNGKDFTYKTNGAGNLIIGYNAAATRKVCSDGSGDSEASCSGIWAANQRTGSHNVIIGGMHQYTQFGGLVIGSNNAIVNHYASISSGSSNTASGQGASISGGSSNTASGVYASVSGGRLGTASGEGASVSGGFWSDASGDYASVSVGERNTASGDYASVSGGEWNTASANYTSISGGQHNEARGESASVSGGHYNTASAKYASVSGGYYNTANGEGASVIGGYNNTASADYSIAP